MMETEKSHPSVKKVERPPILDRIVSERMSMEEKEKITDELLEKFNKQEVEDIKKGEVELTPRQKELVVEANRLIASALGSMGVKPRINITSSMIHFVRPDVFEKYRAKEGISKFAGAWASIGEQAIFIKHEEYDELRLLNRIIHEMLHMNSFVSFQTADIINGIEHENAGIVERRMGLRIKETKMKNGKKHEGETLFSDLDEAVIEKMTVDIIRNFRIRISPELKREFDRSEKLRKILVGYIQKVFKEKGDKISEGEILEIGNLYAILNWQAILLPEADGFLERYEETRDNLVLEQAISFYSDQEMADAMPHFAYGPQRIRFEKLVNKLFDQNKNEFKSAVEVAALFIKASVEGNLLPLARLIEKTFGKGSFRRLGEGVDITDFSAEKS